MIVFIIICCICMMRIYNVANFILEWSEFKEFKSEVRIHSNIILHKRRFWLYMKNHDLTSI